MPRNSPKFADFACELCGATSPRTGARQRYCEACKSAAAADASRKWREANGDRLREYEARRQRDPQENRARVREWAKKNPDLAKAQARRMYESNREAVKKKAAEWAAANRERRREVSAASARRLRAQDPERFRAKARQRRQDPAVRLHESISEQIRQSLRGRKAGASWESLLGYSLHDLVRHLSALFQDGMSMDNYGEWHIDHKRPVASFDFTRPTDEDFAACWALSNLQPLWARENMQKSSTWNGVRHVRRRAHREAPENVAHARAPEVK